jgi:hypothetical protein
MINLSGKLAALALTLVTAGCAVPGKYEWGNYDKSLYSYYKDSSTSAAHVAEIKKIIEADELAKRRTAPGLYGEFGYFLMSDRKFAEAKSYFEKEKATWPESTHLMNLMIKMCDDKPAQPLASKG